MDDYIWEIADAASDVVAELIEQVCVTHPTALVLANRGIAPDTASGFLWPSLSQLTDPYTLPGAKDAAARLWGAIHSGKRILIHGDYDTDGITAAVLLAWVLRQNGADVTCFLPHRIDDGYGLTADSVDRAHQEGYNLIVTVDCGITSYEAATRARELNLDLIITDHHVPGTDPIVAAAVVDPKLPAVPNAIQDLAGVGVAFKVCHAFLKYGREHGIGGMETDLRQGLDLVALGTVADIVPLLHENRALVKFGLKVLSQQRRPGIHALCELASVRDPIRTSDITYRLAPRLNAAGRMGDPNESLQLLEAGSMVDGTHLARVLDEQNRLRQRTEEEAVRAAESQIVRRYDLDRSRSLVVWDADWHQGVVGIVASRLARRYHRPAVVLTGDSNGGFTGSARSVRRVNLVSILEVCQTELTRFGGHAMAAGLSLDSDRLDAFCEQFEEAVRTVLGHESMKPELEVCGEVPFTELDDIFFTELEYLEPFGHSNPEPVFVAHGVHPLHRRLAGTCHTRGCAQDQSGARMDFIAFGRLPDAFPAPPWSLVYTPQLNRFAGTVVPQIRVLDVRSC